MSSTTDMCRFGRLQTATATSSGGVALASLRKIGLSVMGAAWVLVGHTGFAQDAHTAARYSSQLRVAPPATVQQTVGHLPTDPREGLDSRIDSMPQVDQKLEVIHHRSQLVRTRARIARTMASAPGIIDIVPYSETEFSILGLMLGTTDLLIWFENDPEPLKYAATVIRDPALEDRRRIDYGKVERKLQILYPNSKVWLIPLSRRVIVRGQARDPEEATRIMQTVRLEVANLEFSGRNFGDDSLNGGGGGGGGDINAFNSANFGNNNNVFNSFVVDELRIPGEFQVKVRVRLAELSHMQLRRYGLDLQTQLNDGRNIVTSAMASAPVISGLFDNGKVNCLLDALAVNGTAKIVEDASFVVLSGEPAAFLAGGEFAVPTTVGIGGAAAATTSFRGYGTSIIATPTLIDNDLFRLQVVAELSALNNQNSVAGIPGLNVKRVQTRVELREGQTIVLGGLYGRTQRADVTRIPFLGEIPVIGTWLFHTKRATEDENELLVVVTPELVRAIDSDQQPPLPGFHVTHPDCYDFWKYNRTEGNPDLGHYQMMPYGQGQPYAQDVGYNVYNPAPAGGGMAPQAGGYGASYGGMPMPAQNYGPVPSAPNYGPTGGQPQPVMSPTPAPAPQPTPAMGPQAYRQGSYNGVQQTSGVRGVPRNVNIRPTVRR